MLTFAVSSKWPVSDMDFDESSAVQCAILGGATTGLIVHCFAIGTIKHAITGAEHVIVQEYRTTQPEPRYRSEDLVLPMEARNRTQLDRRATFYITAYNTECQTVSDWQASSAPKECHPGSIVVGYEYLHTQLERITVFLAWYHFNPQPFHHGRNIRDTPLWHTALNVASFLKQEKEKAAGDIPGQRLIKLHDHLVDAGLTVANSDWLFDGFSDYSIAELVTQARK